MPTSTATEPLLTGHKAPSTSGTNAPRGPPTTLPCGTKKAYSIRNSPFVVDTRYDVIKAIGLGAYGLVCSAKDTATGRYVAIKKIPKLFQDLVDARRVLREIHCMRLLGGRHPHLLELLDVMAPIEDSAAEQKSFNEIYLVSELFDTDLHGLLKSKHKITFEHHTFISYQIFKGLAFTHAAGIMHRDLKPGNIFLGAQCSVCVGDFGLARGGVDFRARVQVKDEHIGDQAPGIIPVDLELTDYVITRWYRSPELLLMLSYEHSVDMWSCGCILAEMMLRKPLFQGTNYLQQFEVISHLVDFPADAHEAAIVLPNATAEQCRMTVRLGKSLQDREVNELGEVEAAKMSTRVRLFRRFGLDPEGCSRTWNRYMDMVSQLLTFDPARRLTACEAVLHPYVSHLAKNDEQLATFRGGHAALQTYTRERLAQQDLHKYWAFDRADLTEEMLRREFWAAMHAHPGVFAAAGARLDDDDVSDDVHGPAQDL